MKDFFKSNWQGIVIILLGLFLMNRCTMDHARDKIDAANERRDELLELNEAVNLKVASLEAEKINIQTEKDAVEASLVTANTELNQTKGRITTLESDLESSIASTKMIRTNDNLLDSFKEHFPTYAESADLGVMDVKDEDGLIAAVVTMPAFSIKGFIRDKIQAENLTRQVDEYHTLEEQYGGIVELHIENEDLQSKLTTATEKQSTEFERGRDACLSSYSDLHNDYAKEVNKPRFSLFPDGNLWKFGTGVVVGGVACGAATGNIKFNW